MQEFQISRCRPGKKERKWKKLEDACQKAHDVYIKKRHADMHAKMHADMHADMHAKMHADMHAQHSRNHSK